MTTNRHKVLPRLTTHARSNRRPLTPPEARLWRHLRDRQLAGLKFRRQQVIGPYIADFCCFDARLIVELDGDSHVEQAGYDRRRTAWLEGQGFAVLRFNNSDAMRDVEAVLEGILLACGRSDEDVPSASRAGGDSDSPSPPAPLPRRGEGSTYSPLVDHVGDG